MSDLLVQLVQGVREVVYSFGYPGVFVLIALANLYLPIPTELVLPLAGSLVAQGRFSFLAVLAAATAGSLVGALVVYSLGRRLGEENLRRFVGRFGRLAFVYELDLDKASRWFERHGAKAVIIARLVPGVGSLISVPAGLERMPVWRFVAYTALGSALWNGAFVGLGWALGSQWRLARQYAHILQYLVMAAVAGAILWFLWRRWRRE